MTVEHCRRSGEKQICDNWWQRCRSWKTYV